MKQKKELDRNCWSVKLWKEYTCSQWYDKRKKYQASIQIGPSFGDDVVRAEIKQYAEVCTKFTKLYKKNCESIDIENQIIEEAEGTFRELNDSFEIIDQPYIA